MVSELPTKEDDLFYHLLTAYVQRVIARKGDPTRYPLAQMLCWLSWLAQQMRTRNLTLFSVELLHLDGLPGKNRLRYRWSVELIGGLIALFQHISLRFWLQHADTFPFQIISFLEDARARHSAGRSLLS